MPSTRRQTVVNSLVTLLQTINGSGAYVNNFSTSGKVRQWRSAFHEIPTGDLPCLVVFDTDDQWGENAETMMSPRFLRSLTVDVVGVASTADAARTVIADVLTALNTQNRTIDGTTAEFIEPVSESLRVDEAGDKIVVATIRFTVRYTQTFDPYTA